MKKIILLSALMLMPMTAQATEGAADRVAIPYMGGTSGVPAQDCKMVETISLGVNFNNINIEIGKAKSFVDEKMAEIEAFAKEVGIGKFEVQNVSYNVYANNYSGGCGMPSAPAQYQMNGSFSYTVDDAAKAAELTKKVEAKGYQINLNSSAYRQCQ